MNFLSPSFLWALFALSIPLIIHLFNFRKTKRVYFSNNRFLKQVKEETASKKRLKHLLILAARLLFIFFLVITFAQPFIPAKNQSSAAQEIVLYLDNSLSMTGNTEGDGRGLEEATQYARDIANIFPPDTRYKLLTNDFAPFSNVYKTKAEVLDLLTEIRASSVSRSFEEIQNRIALNNKNEVRKPELFWISDFQRSTMGPVTVSDSSINIHLVPIVFEETPNVFVDSVFLENPFAIGGDKNVLHVRLLNDGSRSIDQLNIRFSINNIQAGTASVSIPQKGTAEATFDLTTGLTGRSELRISFNDNPINFDNSFFLTLNFTDKIRVLEVKNSLQPTPVQQVFGNKQLFAYQGFTMANMNYSLLSQADLVVVNGLNVIDPTFALALQNYLDAFGTVMLIPGDAPDLSSMSSTFSVTLRKHSDSLQMKPLDKPDFDNPFFENVFEERSQSVIMPKAIPAFTWGNDRNALLKFNNELPFLSVFDRKGKLYMLASGLTSSVTDFAAHGLFVPVMYRIAASSKRDTENLYYTLQDDFVSIQVDTLTGEEPLRMIGEQELIPSQRRLGNRVLMDLPKFSLTQGFYYVVQTSDTMSLLAFNLDKKESRMEQYQGEEVKSMLGGGDHIDIFEAASSEAFSNEIKERYLGKPLWRYALLLALFFLLIEILIIRFLK